MSQGKSSSGNTDPLRDNLPARSIELDHCWVCGKKFTEFGGEPSNFKHDHHLVPRAYGGVDGPTVSLCDSHHTTLHQVALKLYSGKPYFDLLTKDHQKDKKILWLASVVVNARYATENDPNKPMMLTLSLDNTSKSKLKALKLRFPKSSYASIVAYAIAQLYVKHFQE